MIRQYIITSLILGCSIIGCSGETVPNGRILFRNDSQDSEYNVIVVNGVSLSPGEKTLLSSGTTRISVSRAYKDRTRYYTVECPDIRGPGISIRLIDVHVNRIAGGCKTIEAS